MKYDVVIIGAGPGGIFSAYELMEQNNDLKDCSFRRWKSSRTKDTARLTETK